MKSLKVFFGLSLVTFFGSSIFAPSTVDAQTTAQCDWFTGTYQDIGNGVIVHLGSNQLVVYNGNPKPLSGRCIDSERIQVNFGNKNLIGRKARNAPEVAWSNGTVWRRVSYKVEYPLSF